MLYRCRCRKCEGRRTLPRHPNDYLRPRICRNPGCGGHYRLDKYRTAGLDWQVCRCGGYHYPHRKGSKFCEANWRAPYNVLVERTRELEPDSPHARAMLAELMLDAPGRNYRPGAPIPF